MAEAVPQTVNVIFEDPGVQELLVMLYQNANGHFQFLTSRKTTRACEFTFSIGGGQARDVMAHSFSADEMVDMQGNEGVSVRICVAANNLWYEYSEGKIRKVGDMLFELPVGWFEPENMPQPDPFMEAIVNKEYPGEEYDEEPPVHQLP
ncbi:hypothetical protein ACLOJK_016164 [Asimina triloba]